LKVEFEGVSYESPVRGDHIILVPRYVLNRHVDDVVVENTILISGILCDLCGHPIRSWHVPVLILCRPMRPWGALCPPCADKLFKTASDLKERIFKLERDSKVSRLERVWDGLKGGGEVGKTLHKA